MLDKLKALMETQKKMQEIKRQLDNTVFEIVSSDGLIKLTMSGTQELKDIRIQGEIKEVEKSALEKAFKDAYNRAIKRCQDIAAQNLKDITGLNIPGLM